MLLMNIVDRRLAISVAIALTHYVQLNTNLIGKQWKI